MSQHSLIRGKAIEALVLYWLTNKGYACYIPYVDIEQTDIVFRHPVTKRLVGLQVKHKEPESFQDYLFNDWQDGNFHFDAVVLYQPLYSRGLILPPRMLIGKQRKLYFEQYIKGWESTGTIHETYQECVFDEWTFPDVLVKLTDTTTLSTPGA